MSESSFKGRKRGRQTPKSVRTKEKIARVFISLGGAGTIVSVVLIFVFLVWVVAPLFATAGVQHVVSVKRERGNVRQEVEILASGVDELQLVGWMALADGRLRTFTMNDGETIADTPIFGGTAPTAWSFLPDGPEVAFGFEDGTVRKGKIAFVNQFLEDQEITAELRQLEPGQSLPYRDGVVVVTPERQHRLQRLEAELGEPAKIGDAAVTHLDFSVTPQGNTAYAAMSADGRLAIYTFTTRENFLTGEMETRVESLDIPYEPDATRGPPRFVRLSGVGTELFLLWEDGLCMRFDARDPDDAKVMERVDVVDGDVQVTTVTYHISKTTLLIGDSGGTTRAWFLTRPDGAFTDDGAVLTPAHTLGGPASPVTALAPSPRSRMLAAGYESGDLRVFLVTTSELLASPTSPQSEPVRSLLLTPKEDGVVAFGPSRINRWSLDPKYPTGTMKALFTKIWYEGYNEPQHSWQSTGGTDDFEPKLGMIPLIFGTIKATIYAILIAAPLALLAAIFTSEFMNPRLRAPIKSVIEMMAGLPSVVLGFMAALVIAPFVQGVLPSVLLAFYTIPFAVVLGARAWQLLPHHLQLRLTGWPRFAAVMLVFPMGILMASLIGPWFESTFFAGDMKAWLAGGDGDPAGGWMLMMIPVCLLVVVALSTRFVQPWLRSASANWSELKCAVADLLKLAATVLASVLLAWVLSELLAGAGSDPRGGIFGQYAQRNALIVGFVMGFAVVPIIYTLAEDALSSVPQQLREGSLGCGATPWQTAWRVIIPTATSGLFGALMVGLGRAVGETMIVLMAAGNSPILEWNIFSGFRTLAANIATELPEAVKDSAHYRTLFGAALVLFAMTFVINTGAEVVRTRFRKRSAQL